MKGAAEATDYLQLARLVMRLSRHLDTTLDAAIYPKHGLTMKHHMVMRTIQDGLTLTPGDVTERLQIPPASVSRILARLEAERLIERTQDRKDLRRVLLNITPAGMGMALAIQRTIADTLAERYAHVSASAMRRANNELASLDEALRPETPELG